MLSHRHNWLALAVLLLPGILAIGISNDLPSARYRSAAAEVRIPFFATDEDGRSIDTVNKEDFAVVDNELVVRNFRSFSRSGETALDIVAVVDVSESVAPRLRVGMHDVLQLLSHNQPVSDDRSDDRISVMSFAGGQPAVICSGNCRGPAAQSRLVALQAAGATRLFDAVAFGADFISHRGAPGVKPVLILFSDGDDTSSRTSLGEALQAAIASNAAIYSVDLGNPENPSDGSRILQQMSEATGGRYFPIHQGAASVLKDVIEDLHASYVVTYQLPSLRPGFHSLRLLPAHNLNLKFHCRNGYYYENSAP
ncbi:MAG: VWA domain-containing protein [Terriglobales bacterium]